MKPPIIAVGGMVPATGHLILDRPEDALFLDYARTRAGFSVSGCRTMGKSTLYTRWSKVLAAEGIRLVYLDVATHLEEATSANQWVDALASAVDAELGLAGALDLPRDGSIPFRLEALLHKVQTASDHSRAVLFLDEIDSLRRVPSHRAIVEAFRTVQADLGREDAPAAGLCFVGLRPLPELGSPIGGSASPHAAIHLRDFPQDLPTARALAVALSSSGTVAVDIAARLLAKCGGQPLLTMEMAERVRREQIDSVDALDDLLARQLEQQRSDPSGLFRMIEDFVLEQSDRAYTALNTWIDLLEGRRDEGSRDAPGAQLLRLCGLARAERGRLIPKNVLFREHFDVPWANRLISRIAQRTRRVPAAGPRKRVCVINTGGTIGMIQRDGQVVPPADQAEFLSYFAEVEAVADVDFVPLYEHDSVNMSPVEWAGVARAVYERRNDGYAGFVVTHGTDTMAHTASAVAFALGPSLSFPVVFTGAQATPDQVHADARTNLLRACLVAQQPIPEVVICFGNHVYRACRAQKRDERAFDAFESPGLSPLAEVGEEIEVFWDRVRGMPAEDAERPLHADFAKGIMLIQLTAGLEPEFYEPGLEVADHRGRLRCRGLIVQTLGAGNVAHIEPFSFLPLIARALRLHIPVLVTSPFPWRPGPTFAPQAESIRLGAFPTGQMTAAAAAAKLRWAIARADRVVGVDDRPQHLEHVRSTMKQDQVGEIADHRWRSKP